MIILLNHQNRNYLLHLSDYNSVYNKWKLTFRVKDSHYIKLLLRLLENSSIETVSTPTSLAIESRSSQSRAVIITSYSASIQMALDDVICSLNTSRAEWQEVQGFVRSSHIHYGIPIVLCNSLFILRWG